MSEIQTLTDSSYSTDSTDLPKEMDQDFVSASGDYDYPFYLSEKEEWVNYKNKNTEDQECPKRFPDPCPRFNYPVGTSNRDMAILEHKWWLETKNGLLDKHVDRCDNVHAVGYCTLKFIFGQQPRKEITFKDLSAAKLNFLANKVIGIAEYEYNAKICSWMSNVVRRRYNENLGKPESIPKEAT